jgi:imidazolonepropionase-like amidohydrolase
VTRVLFTLLALAALALFARSARADVVVIDHGTVFVPGGPPLADGTVVLDGGRVRAVGKGVAAPAGARRIDATGKVVTPGFIDASSQVGMVDVELEATTDDTDPTGDPFQPALRAIDGYNPRAVGVALTRAYGVTSVVLAPSFGVLGGQSAFVDLDGASVAEALVKAPLAQHARIDEPVAHRYGGARVSLWLRLREALEDARFFATHRQAYDDRRSRDLALRRVHLEALLPVIRGEMPLVVTAHRASDIEALLRLADELKLRVVLSGASEAWMVAAELARRKVPTIVDPLEDLPARFDRLRARSDNAALLARAGVPVILSTFSALQTRLLWQRAANAVRTGMDHDAAIRAVTEAPAAAFGMVGYGRLEAGAVANVVVWSGDPLQTSTRTEHVFVRGREIPLETRQSLLLKRYRTLPATR